MVTLGVSIQPVYADTFDSELPAALSQSVSNAVNIKAMQNEQIKEAGEVIESQSESAPLTLQDNQNIIRYYAEEFMPIKGCSLLEDLPKDSNINYVAPQTKKSSPDNATLHARKIDMSASEREWLLKLVQAEAGNQPYEGKVAVATTIANRVDSPDFPNTVMGVITQGNGSFHQFSPWDDGAIYHQTPSKETIQAVKQVFDLGERNLPKDVVYFSTTAVAPNSWIGQTRKHVKTIAEQAFFSIQSK